MALKMQAEGDIKPGNMVGHLVILKEFQTDPTIGMPSDCMPAKLDFHKPFYVRLPDRDVWSAGGPSFERGSMVWFTDGSKTEDDALSKSLGTNATVFPAEVHAIELCATIGIAKVLNGAKIYIVSDSQSALKALRFCTVESRLAWNCLKVIKHLAGSNKVTLMWVPRTRGFCLSIY